MFFRNNKGSDSKNTSAESKNNAIDFNKFFSSRNREDLTMLANELSPEAKEFFDQSIFSMLGTLPEELAETTITMSKESLHQLLFSSMVTGYLSKSVENRMQLERIIMTNNSDSTKLDECKVNKPSIDDVL